MLDLKTGKVDMAADELKPRPRRVAVRVEVDGCGPVFGRAQQQTIEKSPDGKWQAVYKDFNVVLEPLGGESKDPIIVTKDGTERLRFGTCCWVYGEELNQSDAMWWSPDSKTLAYYEVDEQANEGLSLDVGQYIALYDAQVGQISEGGEMTIPRWLCGSMMSSRRRNRGGR